MATQQLTTILEHAILSKSGQPVPGGISNIEKEVIGWLCLNEPRELIEIRISMFPDVADNRTVAAQKIGFESILSNAGQNKFAQELLNTVYETYGIAGYRRLWKKGYQSESSIRELWSSCKRTKTVLFSRI